MNDKPQTRWPRNTRLAPRAWFLTDAVKDGERYIIIGFEDKDTHTSTEAFLHVDDFRAFLRTALDMAADIAVAERSIA